MARKEILRKQRKRLVYGEVSLCSLPRGEGGGETVDPTPPEGQLQKVSLRPMTPQWEHLRKNSNVEFYLE